MRAVRIEDDSAAQPVEDVPAVSWLLCTHVADEQLRQAMQSCLNQSFTDFELLVVVNGASANDVAARVRLWFGGDSRVRLLITEVRHLTFSLGLGVHCARADLIARMDGDDLSRPDRLKRQVEFMELHPEITVLGSAYDLIDCDGILQQTVLLPTEDSGIRKALFRGNPICHPSVMFRRDAVLAIGGYLGGIYAQDYDLWARLAANPNNRFANLCEVCLSYRTEGAGRARRSRRAYASMAASQFRNFVQSAGFAWGLAALLSTAKAFVYSVPIRPKM